MRVLNTRTGKFVEVDPDETKTKYAILSHTWDAAGEQTYQDVLRIQTSILYRIETVLVWACIPAWCGFLAFLAFLSSGIHHTMCFFRRIAYLRSSTTLLPHAMARSETKHWVLKGPGRWAKALKAQARHIRRWNSIHFSYRLSAKVRCACAVALADGYCFIWIDSCCIDKTSSSELSEAINSMYHWYGRSHRCYALLADVPDLEKGDLYKEGSSFRKSKWFERGWTLQELIAPQEVVFMSSQWNALGSRFFLADLVESITGIEIAVLIHEKPLDKVSVATRMSWAALRKTTRVEDRAYSLFGIFGVNMSTLYGEGSLAFRRLQLKILKQIPDQSIFAWSGGNDEPYLKPLLLRRSEATAPSHSNISSVGFLVYGDERSLLADSPKEFQHSGHIRPVPHHTHRERLTRLGAIHRDDTQYYTPTPHGIRTELALLDIREFLSPDIVRDVQHADAQWYLAILGCESSDQDEAHFLARVCYLPSSQPGLRLLHAGYLGIERFDVAYVRPDIVMLRYSQVEQCVPQPAVKIIYIPHPKHTQPSASGPPSFRSFPEDVHIIPSRWAGRMLEAQEYTVTVSQPFPDGPRSCRLILSKGGETIYIRCWGKQPPLYSDMRVDAEASIITDTVSCASDDRAISSDYIFFGKERQNAFNVDATTATGTIRVRVVLERTSEAQIALAVRIPDTFVDPGSGRPDPIQGEMQTSQGTRKSKVTVRWESHVYWKR